MVTSSQESEPLVDSDTSPTTPEDDQPRVDPDWPLDPPEDPEEVDPDRPLDPPGGPDIEPTDPYSSDQVRTVPNPRAAGLELLVRQRPYHQMRPVL